MEAKLIEDPPPKYENNYETSCYDNPIMNQPQIVNNQTSSTQEISPIIQTQVTQPQTYSNQFRHGLTDCFSSLGLCCDAFCCPCIVYGQIQEKIGSGSKFGQCCCYSIWSCFIPIFTGLYGVPISLSCCMICGQRHRVRQLHGIEGNSCSDCCTSFWCGTCTLIQHAKQVGVR